MLAAAGALVAGSTLLTPTAAFAAEGDVIIEGDSYTKVLFHRDLYPGGTTWDASCPTDFPWLDGTQGTPNRDVGRGIIVSESSVAVWWHGDARLALTENDPVNGIPSQHAVTGFSGSVANFVPFPIKIGVEIKMVCTKDQKKAWIWGE
jgi:hypothetical protein